MMLPVPPAHPRRASRVHPVDGVITVVKPLVALRRRGRIAARIVLEQHAGRRNMGRRDRLLPQRQPRYAHASGRGTGTRRAADVRSGRQSAGAPGRVRRPFAARRVVAAGDAGRVSPRRGAGSCLLAARRPASAIAKPALVQCFAPVDLLLVPAECSSVGWTSESVPHKPDGLGGPSYNGRLPGPIKIVYATSRTQDALCEIFLPALERILRRRGDQVEAHFWGCRPPRIISWPNVRHHGLVCRYDRYLRRFFRAGYDIGLAPLPDDVFYRSNQQQVSRVRGQPDSQRLFAQRSLHGLRRARGHRAACGQRCRKLARRDRAADRRCLAAGTDSASCPAVCRRALRRRSSRSCFLRSLKSSWAGKKETGYPLAPFVRGRTWAELGRGPFRQMGTVPFFRPASGVVWANTCFACWARCGVSVRIRPGPRSAGSCTTAVWPSGSAGGCRAVICVLFRPTPN